MMHFRFFCLSCLIPAAVLLSGCKRPALTDRLIGPLSSNTLIAVVNGSNIYAGPIEDIVQRYMAQYQEATGNEMTAEQLSRQRRQLIDQLITAALLQQRLAASDITVPAHEFEQEYIDIVTNRFGTWDEFETSLAHDDVTTAQFARAVCDQLKLFKLVRKEMNVSDATEDDARAYYAEHSNQFDFAPAVSLSHILIKSGADDAPDVQSNNVARLEKVRAQVLAGLPFADAAKKYSECPSKKHGGYLGTIFEDDLGIPEFIANVAFSLPVSNVSSVVESDHGYHLFYVTQRIPAHTASYDQIRAELLQALNQHKFQDAFQQWLIKIRADAVIEEKL